MHAVIKDDAARVLDGITGVSLCDSDEWLPSRPDAAACEVYENNRGARGKLVATYVRDATTGRWLPKSPRCARPSPQGAQLYLTKSCRSARRRSGWKGFSSTD